MEQIKCPACGGTIMIDESRAVLFCPYCGIKMPKKEEALDKIIRHEQHMQQFEEEIRQRKVKEGIEAEERDRKSTMRIVIGCVIVAIAIGIVFFLGIRGENKSEEKLQALVTEIQADMEAGNYDVALFKAEQLQWPHSDLEGKNRWNKQREALKKVIKEAKKNAGK